MLLITVVLGHVSAVTLPSLSELNDISLEVAVIVILKVIAGFGREAAYLFVLFSGYATAHHFSHSTRSHAASSWAKRLKRLYPPFAYALVVTIVLDGLGSFFMPSYYEQAFPFTYVATENGSAFTLFCNITMLQPTACQSYGTNGPLWTIGYLMQFYFAAWLLRAMAVGFGTMSLLGYGFAVAAGLMLSIEWAALFALWIFGLQLRISLVDQGHGIPAIVLAAIVMIGLLVAKSSEPFWSIVLTGR